MPLSEDEILQKHAKHCGHCSRNTLVPYEYEWTCFGCGYNVIKRKHDVSIKQRRKINLINRVKYTEQKNFLNCIDVYKKYECADYGKIYEVLSILKIDKTKINNILIEKYKNVLEDPNFEQDYWSRTAGGVYKIGYDSNGLMKWICYYDRSYYEKKIF